MKKLVLFVIAGLLSASQATLTFGDGKRSITLMDAIRIATESVPGKVIKAEQMDDIFEVRIKTEGGSEEKVQVDAEKGAIVGDKGISLEDAKAIALKEVPGKVEKVLSEKGQYRITIRAESGTTYEVIVYANSGKVGGNKKRTYHYDETTDTWSQ